LTRSKDKANPPLTQVLFDPTWRDFFDPKGKKSKKFDVFRENFLNPNHKWLTQPEPQKIDPDP